LSKRHHSKLLRTRQSTNATVTAIALHVTGKRAPRQKIHQLRKQRLACVHENLPEKPGKLHEYLTLVQIDTTPFPPGSPLYHAFPPSPPSFNRTTVEMSTSYPVKCMTVKQAEEILKTTIQKEVFTQQSEI
jgi:hypothetical protein